MWHSSGQWSDNLGILTLENLSPLFQTSVCGYLSSKTVVINVFLSDFVCNVVHYYYISWAIHTRDPSPFQRVSGRFSMESIQGDGVFCVGYQLHQLDISCISSNTHLQGNGGGGGQGGEKVECRWRSNSKGGLLECLLLLFLLTEHLVNRPDS